MSDHFIFAAIYFGIAALFCFGIMLSCIDGTKHHWTRPFAGILWPLLAVISIWIIWVKRYD